MPDADKLHNKLSFRHRQTYQELDEGVIELDEIADQELRNLIKDAQAYGDAPIKLICQIVTTVFDKIPSEPLLKLSVDWKKLTTQIEKLARDISFQMPTRKRGIDLAVEVSKQHLLSIKRDECLGNNKIALISSYLQRVHQAEFEGRIPTTGQQSKGLQIRLEEMKELMKPGIKKYAEQIARDDSTCRMRKPPRRKRCPGLHDDLLKAN